MRTGPVRPRPELPAGPEPEPALREVRPQVAGTLVCVSVGPANAPFAGPTETHTRVPATCDLPPAAQVAPFPSPIRATANVSLLFTSFHLSLSSLCRHLLPPFFRPSLPLPLFFPSAIPFAPLIPLVLATVCLFLAPFFLSSFLFLLFLFASPYRRGLLFIRFFNAAVRNSGREAPQGNRKYRMGNGGEWVSPPSPSLLPLVQGGITSR